MGPQTEELLTAGIQQAFSAFLKGYARWGGWQHPGWSAETEDAYKGPLIWSEADCAATCEAQVRDSARGPDLARSLAGVTRANA